MRARYTAIYKLHGVNTITEAEREAKLLDLSSPKFEVTLSDDPDLDFEHIDKAAAIGAQIFGNIAGVSSAANLEDALAVRLSQVRTNRAKRVGKGVFLIFNGELEVEEVEHKSFGTFGFCLSDFDKQTVRNTFSRMIEGVIASILLNLAPNLDPRVTKLGEIAYLIDSQSKMPIYALRLEMGEAYLSLSSPLAQDAINSARELALYLAKDKVLLRPVHLLIRSLHQNSDTLQSFIAAWSALEIFINSVFKTKYEAQWAQTLEAAAPRSAQPVFKRLKVVMTDKYRLADKFVMIATLLEPDSAEADSATFQKLKKIRDDLFHALESAGTSLPIEEAQKLMLKYLRLHLRNFRSDAF